MKTIFFLTFFDSSLVSHVFGRFTSRYPNQKSELYMCFHDLPPLICIANCMSLGIMVTLFACIAHMFVSSNKPTKNASDASCNAKIAVDWNRVSSPNSWAISLTNLWKGALRINNSVFFWYRWISLKATIPGRYLCGFLTPGERNDFLPASSSKISELVSHMIFLRQT
jgi:hypothetical protein